MIELFKPEAVKQALQLFIPQGAVTEVRLLDATTQNYRRPRTMSGYFDDPDKVVAALRGIESAKGVYFTFNELPKALLSARCNRLTDVGKDQTTNDKEVTRRRWLIVDLDPERPSKKISSSAEEFKLALQRADAVRQWLQTEMGWPEPIRAASGNGGHLAWKIDLPTDDGGLVQRFLVALAKRFDDDLVKVDITLFNPSRIIKLYGTLAAKGDSTPDRPHRHSKILSVPSPIITVPREMIEAVAGQVPEQTRVAKPSQTPSAQGRFDVDAFLLRHARVLGEHSKGGDRIIEVQCPFNPEHAAGEAHVQVMVNGKLGFACKHNSCAGKTWADFREHYEPGYKAERERKEREWESRQQSGGARATTPTAGTNGTPAAISSENAEEWTKPEPLPGGLPPVPAFDYECLPETLRAWIQDIAERLQCPPDFPAATALVAMGSLIGRRVGIRPKRCDEWLVLANIWGGVIGRPGIMKSPAIAAALVPLDRLVAEALDDYKRRLADHKINKALLAAKAKRAEKDIAKHLAANDEDAARLAAAESVKTGDEAEPTLLRYVVNDSTVAKLGELLNQNPDGLLYHRDELIGLLRSLDREDNEEARAFLLEAWDGSRSYVFDRIGRGTVIVESLTLGVFGGIQPDLLLDYVRQAVRGGAGADGLMQRLQVLVWPDISKEWRNVDRWPDGPAKERAWQVFKRLSCLQPDAIGAEIPEQEKKIPFLRFAADAQEVFDGWRQTIEIKLRDGSEHVAFEAHLSKYRKLVPAVALILHLANGDSGPVTLAALQCALRWAAYLEGHARRIYSALLSPDLAAARELGRHIERGDLGSRFSLREVYKRDWAGLSSKADAEVAVEILVDAGWIRPAADKSTQMGRPSVVYDINPQTRRDDQGNIGGFGGSLKEGSSVFLEKEEEEEVKISIIPYPQNPQNPSAVATDRLKVAPAMMLCAVTAEEAGGLLRSWDDPPCPSCGHPVGSNPDCEVCDSPF